MWEVFENNLFLKGILMIPKLYLQSLDFRSLIEFFIHNFFGKASKLPTKMTKAFRLLALLVKLVV